MPVTASATVNRNATGLSASAPGAGLALPGTTKGKARTKMSPASVRPPCTTTTPCGTLEKLAVWKRSLAQAAPASTGCVSHVSTTPSAAAAVDVGNPATSRVPGPGARFGSRTERWPLAGSTGTAAGSIDTQQLEPDCDR